MKSAFLSFLISSFLLRFLDMHMYVTSALQRTDMKAVGLQLALDLLHEKVRRQTLLLMLANRCDTKPNTSFNVSQSLRYQTKSRLTFVHGRVGREEMRAFLPIVNLKS